MFVHKHSILQNNNICLLYDSSTSWFHSKCKRNFAPQCLLLPQQMLHAELQLKSLSARAKKCKQFVLFFVLFSWKPKDIQAFQGDWTAWNVGSTKQDSTKQRYTSVVTTNCRPGWNGPACLLGISLKYVHSFWMRALKINLPSVLCGCCCR